MLVKILFSLRNLWIKLSHYNIVLPLRGSIKSLSINELMREAEMEQRKIYTVGTWFLSVPERTSPFPPTQQAFI